MKTRQNKNGEVLQNPFVIELIYRVKLFRIAFSFSREDLAFLLGYPPHRIKAIEQLKPDHEYHLTDLFYLGNIFGCHPSELFPEGHIPDEDIIVRSEEYRRSGKLVQEAWQIKDDGTDELLWKLPEPDITAGHFRDQLPDLMQQITDVVLKLVTEGYFNDPWEAAEIYKVCREAMGHKIKPRHLEKVLKSFIGKQETPLKKVQSGNRYAYVKG